MRAMVAGLLSLTAHGFVRLCAILVVPYYKYSIIYEETTVSFYYCAIVLLQFNLRVSVIRIRRSSQLVWCPMPTSCKQVAPKS